MPAVKDAPKSAISGRDLKAELEEWHAAQADAKRDRKRELEDAIRKIRTTDPAKRAAKIAKLKAQFHEQEAQAAEKYVKDLERELKAHKAEYQDRVDAVLAGLGKVERAAAKAGMRRNGLPPVGTFDNPKAASAFTRRQNGLKGEIQAAERRAAMERRRASEAKRRTKPLSQNAIRYLQRLVDDRAAHDELHSVLGHAPTAADAKSYGLEPENG